MISTEAMASLRTLASRALPETVAVLRNTPVADGYGGQTDVWAEYATVQGRVSLTGQRPDERAIADKVQAAVTYTLSLPAGTDVEPRDRLGLSGRVFEVVGVLKPTWEVTRRVVAVEVG